MKDWKVIKEFCDNNFHFQLPKHTIAVYAHKNNDSIAMCTVGGALTDSQKKKVIIKWENVGRPDYMAMRVNTALDRARVLNAVFIQNADNADNVDKAVAELKSQGKVGADVSDLPQALSDMHKSGVGKHICGADNDGNNYDIVYSKSADMYDGKMSFKFLDLLPILLFDLKEDTGAQQEQSIMDKQDEPAPESESFDFTDEALKEMKELGGIE